VDRQLTLLAESINSITARLSGGAQGTTPQAADPIAALSAPLKYLTDLAKAYPAVKDMPAYVSALVAAQNLDKQVASLGGQMLVTTQLETIAEQIGALALGLRSPLLAAEPEALAAQAENLTLLKRYLSGLGEAFPFIRAEAQYVNALASLEEIEKGVAQIQKGLYVPGQLNIVADSLDGLAKQLDNPASLLQINASENLSVFRSYMVELAERYPWVASEASFTQVGQHLSKIAEAAVKLQGGPVSMTDLPGILSALKSEIAGMSGAVRNLSASFASKSPDAVFIPKDLPSGMANPKTMASQVEALGIALLDVTRAFAQTQPDARYMPEELLSGVSNQVGARLGADLQVLSANLSGLSQQFLGQRAYFYPEALLGLYPGAEGLGKAFVSEDGAATRMYAILEPEPYSNEALDVSLAIRERVSAESAGKKVYITGSSIAFADIRQISNEDFMKVLILTLLGVLVVMILLLRSVVAPVYLVLTVLLSYGCTMGLTVLLFQIMLKQGGVNLLIPTIVLVLLLALGADYNIFLMSRVREETKGADFVQGLVNATSRTGAIISSCGIVLAGTFATMMLSPMTMLLQIGASVAFGVLLDTFVIRGILVPGIARLLKRWNWWPARQ
jgi:RND superfamily putative drug exporter